MTQAATHGYEAVVLVVLILAMATTLGLFYKAAIARENRLAERVTSLETSLEENLVVLVKDTTAALTQNSDTLKETNVVLQEVKRCVVDSHRDTARLLARVESSVCCLSSLGMISDETQNNIDHVKNTLKELPPIDTT